MIAPEIILDRWIKKLSREHPQFAGYVGKLDLDKVEPSTVRSFLQFVQVTMNSALQLENANASGGVQHPPYHFDYVQVNDGTRNAHAFQHGGFSFIIVTLPLVELLLDLSVLLSKSAVVQALLGINPATVRLDAVQALLFQFQLTFLVSHEYTHHVHEHVPGEQIGGIWTEFFEEEAIGGLDSQAQELNADGYAIYLVLANFVRGGGRQGALMQLGRPNLLNPDADELLFMCFFVALTGLFCALWPEDIRTDSIGKLGHPPAPVRIEYGIRIAKMWCSQNESLPESWFGAERFNALFRAGVEAIGGTTPGTWDAHIAFLQSDPGAEYNRQLLERFEVIRGRGHGPTYATAKA
jgi:hypothetical protein